MALQREPAHRMFATEYNASRHVIQGEGEKDPSFVVSPLGAKVNRIHTVGVCTDVEAVGESGELWRARISDPTGVFTVYAGQYQPEAANTLSNLQPPAFVSVTGKARTYEPEPGSIFVSIRPETVSVVDESTRDQWVLTTAKRTADRAGAINKLHGSPELTKEQLVEAGVAEMDAEGATLAQQAYGLTDIDRFVAGAKDALTFLRDGEVPVHRIEAREEGGEQPTQTTEAPAYVPAKPAETDAADDEMDKQILAVVQGLEGDDGAQWDDVLEKAGAAGATSEDVEEALNRLMDKGMVYEPTLGILKTT